MCKSEASMRFIKEIVRKIPYSQPIYFRETQYLLLDGGYTNHYHSFYCKMINDNYWKPISIFCYKNGNVKQIWKCESSMEM